jgi:hypothetical protein
VPVSAAERATAVAVTPLWLACTAAWGATTAVLMTWSAVQKNLPR